MSRAPRRLALSCLAALGCTPAVPSDTGPGSESEASESGAQTETGEEQLVELELEFGASFGELELGCGQGFVHEGVELALQDLRMFVSGIELIDAQGEAVPLQLDVAAPWQLEQVALLDFEDGSGPCQEAGTLERNAFVYGRVPERDYVGLRFELGVPAALNHHDASLAEAPLNLASMFWTWQGGYKFLRVDLLRTAPLPGGWLWHLGSTGCGSAGPETPPDGPCARANRAQIEFESFDANNQRVIFDLAEVLDGLSLAADQGGAPGCMSAPDDPECGPLLDSLGLDLDTGTCAEGCAGQRAFRLGPRQDMGGDGDGDSESGDGDGDEGDGDGDPDDGGTPYELDIPESWPQPVIPPANPLTVEKVELGRHLFYDPRLSYTQTQSCSSCHEQELAFADGLAAPSGSTGEALVRNSPGLANVAYMSTLTWSSPSLDTLEAQILIPLFGEDPVELGLTGHEDEVLARFADDPDYQQLFADAFQNDPEPVSMDHIVAALASFCRAIISARSPYDRYLAGELDALSEQALAGRSLFMSELFECHHCHGGFNFALGTDHEGALFGQQAFANTGLYNLDEMGSYPASDRGLYDHTFEPGDMGRFRPPSLRNVGLTAPYMHDGSIDTLKEVLEIYSAGGQLIEQGPNAGDGRLNPHKSPFVSGFLMTKTQRDQLEAFLHSLSDTELLTDPRFANPFE